MTGGNQTRQSQRGLPQITIRVLTLGRGSPVNPTYNDQTLTETEIKEFVANRIKPGYQIVVLPMPPDESHSIIVEVTKSGIMIVDWGGEINREQKIKKWKNYTTFIKKLQAYYPVSYYETDESINIMACERSDANNGQGGCSQYVHKWIEKYIGQDGKNAILLEDD
jgi:N-acetyl-gamma-glutamylphosphate reductase